MSSSSSSNWKSQVLKFHSSPRFTTPSPSPDLENAPSGSQTAQFPAREPSTKSHGRKRPAGHIPRPPNAFMLFRSDFVQNNRVPTSIEKNHQNISRIAGKVWSNMSDVEKREWYSRAEQEKERHAQKYPDYQYSPTDPVSLGRRRQVKKGRSEAEIGTQRRHCEKVASLVVEGRSGPALEQAVRQSETKVTKTPPMQPHRRNSQEWSPAVFSELDDEDSASGSTRTLSISSLSTVLSAPPYSPKDSVGRAPPPTRPIALPSSVSTKHIAPIYQAPSFARSTHGFANVLPSKVRNYGVPPTFPQAFRPRQDMSNSWSLRDEAGSSDDDEEDDYMSDD